jgi:predicted small lipoprotein YifL
MRTTALLLLLVLATTSACGRYGPPLRAQEYRDAQKARDEARRKESEKSDQERNEPLPYSP